MKATTAIVFGFLILSSLAFAEDRREKRKALCAANACCSAREAKQAGKVALDKCVAAWNRDRKSTDTDPQDNCSGEMTNFITLCGSEKTACTPQVAATVPPPAS
jgi:hypothetical protein